MKDYYHILRVSRLAGQEEIKRSYRRLASKYHPDVNPSPDAHHIFIEIRQAYDVLSDPNQKWVYDQRFSQPERPPVFRSAPVFTESEIHDDKRKRRGKKETPEEKLKRHLFAIQRNRLFNKRMRVFACISLVFSLVIFIDHYLPSKTSFCEAYYSFNPEHAIKYRDQVFTIMVGDSPVHLYGQEEVKSVINHNTAFLKKTPIWGILVSVQLGHVVFEAENGLYKLMLLFGLVAVASLYVLYYKLEHDLFYPTFIAYFSNILVVAFIILWLTN